MSKAKIRHCFFCGEELGVSMWDDSFDTCGKPECDLAARPNVEDGEVVALCAELRRPSGIGEPLDHSAMSKAADLLERLAGELAMAKSGWECAMDKWEYVLNASALLKTALAEREAELADMDWLYNLHGKSFPPSLTESEKAVKIIDAHAARQQQKASAEPTAKERE